MFNRPNQNDINDDAQDIRNDVSRLGKVRISGEILLG